MPSLFVTFEGMSLIVAAKDRSEALFIDTTKVQTSPHKHKHEGGPHGQQSQTLVDVLVWIEDNGVRLEGPIVDKSQDLANLDQLVPNEALDPRFTTADPIQQDGWRNTLQAWVRLPGGTLTTTPTPTTGGNIAWTFPAHGSQPQHDRRLTQNGLVRRDNVAGPVRIAVRSMASGSVAFINVNPQPGGDWLIDLKTIFNDVSPVPAVTGQKVAIGEMVLLYACLAGGAGPVPTTKWPTVTAPPPIPVTSDPLTGICPLGFKSIGKDQDASV